MSVLEFKGRVLCGDRGVVKIPEPSRWACGRPASGERSDPEGQKQGGELKEARLHEPPEALARGRGEQRRGGAGNLSSGARIHQERADDSTLPGWPGSATKLVLDRLKDPAVCQGSVQMISCLSAHVESQVLDFKFVGRVALQGFANWLRLCGI